MVRPSIVFPGLLSAFSSYGIYRIPITSTFAFSACALGMCHGLIRSYDEFNEEITDAQTTEISTLLMELAPMPLVNFHLYLESSTTKMGLGHGLFMLPLLCELAVKNWCEDKAEDDEIIETIKHLAVLGNVMALLYLSASEDKLLYSGLAITAFLSRFGSIFLDSYFAGTHDSVVFLFDTIFMFLTAVACGSK